MTMRSTAIAAVMAAAVIGLPVDARAQSSGFAIGYQALHVPDEWMPVGFNVDVATPMRSNVSFVGEFGFTRGDDFDEGGASVKIANLGAGPRWTLSTPGEVAAYVQVLAGVEITSADFVTGREDSDTAFLLQPGIGGRVPMGDRVGLIAQGDWRPVFFSEETDNQFRFVIGVGFHSR